MACQASPSGSGFLQARISEVAQSCPTLCNPVDCSLPDSSLHGILQARILEFQPQHQPFQRTPRTDLLQNGLVGSPCSPRDAQESSPAPQIVRLQFSGVQPSLWAVSIVFFTLCWCGVYLSEMETHSRLDLSSSCTLL